MSEVRKQPPAFMVWMAKNSNAVAAIALILGAIFALIAILLPLMMYVNDQAAESYTPVSAIVDSAVSDRVNSGRTKTNINNNNVDIQYEVDGKTYTAYLSNVDTYNGSLNKGDSITVYYNPDDPSEVAVKTSPRVALFKIILTVISGLAALLAIYAGVTIAKRGIKISAPDASDWRVESGSAPARKVGV